MTDQAFQADLLREGFEEIAARTTAADVFNAPHSHPFDVRGQVLAGAITLAWDGKERSFRSGEVFTMAAGCQHSERYGSEGATILSGRRKVAAEVAQKA